MTQLIHSLKQNKTEIKEKQLFLCDFMRFMIFYYATMKIIVVVTSYVYIRKFDHAHDPLYQIKYNKQQQL